MPIKRSKKDEDSTSRPCCPKCGERLSSTFHTKDLPVHYLDRKNYLAYVFRLWVCPRYLAGHSQWRIELVKGWDGVVPEDVSDQVGPEE